MFKRGFDRGAGCSDYKESLAPRTKPVYNARYGATNVKKTVYLLLQRRLRTAATGDLDTIENVIATSLTSAGILRLRRPGQHQLSPYACKSVGTVSSTTIVDANLEFSIVEADFNTSSTSSSTVSYPELGGRLVASSRRLTRIPGGIIHGGSQSLGPSQPRRRLLLIPVPEVGPTAAVRKHLDAARMATKWPKKN